MMLGIASCNPTLPPGRLPPLKGSKKPSDSRTQRSPSILEKNLQFTWGRLSSQACPPTPALPVAIRTKNPTPKEPRCPASRGACPACRSSAADRASRSATHSMPTWGDVVLAELKLSMQKNMTSATVNVVQKDHETSQSIQELQRAKVFKMKSRKRLSTHKKVIAPSLSGCQAKANDEAPAITDPRASATRSARGKHDSGKTRRHFTRSDHKRPCPCLILSGCQAGDVAPGITADPSGSFCTCEACLAQSHDHMELLSGHTGPVLTCTCGDRYPKPASHS